MSEVLTAHAGGVLTITLNRPDVYNAFNRALHAALRSALEEASAPEVRAVVITGAGKGFCAGQDLREFSELSGSIGDALEETYHPNIRLIRALEKPVIAAVNGPAAGAGLSLASCVRRSRRLRHRDVRAGLRRDRARTRLGRLVVPPHGCSACARAFEWMSSNRKLARRRGAGLGSRLRGDPGRRLLGARRGARGGVGRSSDAGRSG